MVGIVLVSHSYELAQGAAVLSRTMAGDKIHIASAGGLDTPDKAVGTDPMLILHAIETVYSEDGVLVFADMGSALLSAEFAIQLLDEAKQPHVIISDAPFIEGAVCAAVQARMNSPLELILSELKTALLPKQTQLGTTAQNTVSVHNSTDAENKLTVAETSNNPAFERDIQANNTRTLSFVVHTAYGIHARPAAKIVALASTYPHLTITVQKKDSHKPPVSALSLNAIALLNIKKNDGIVFYITGINTEAFCAALTDLAQHNFEDNTVLAPSGLALRSDPAHTQKKPEKTKPAPFTDDSMSTLSGLTGAAGIAQGAARIVQKQKIPIPDSEPQSPDIEWTQFYDACAAAKQDLKQTAFEVQAKGDRYAADIFYAHILMLEDPGLIECVRTAIYTKAHSAARAWTHCIAELKKVYSESENSYVRERASDIDELEQLLLSRLLHTDELFSIHAEGIVIADELTPRQTAQLPMELIKGICTVKGSPTSHAAILARSFGIPALMGMETALLSIQEGTPLILDAEKGLLFIKPSAVLSSSYTALQIKRKEQTQCAESHKHKAAITQSGKIIHIFANTGTIQAAELAAKSGADGIGLLRTEFLFLNHSKPPTEDEQYAAYCATAKAIEGKPVIIRTLDAGGDKKLSYLNLPRDENPFLGYRAIRIMLNEPEFFRTQLRAIIRAAQTYSIKIMFPMISSLHELYAAKKELDTAYEELQRRNISIEKKLSVGMMIEVPSAALQAEIFAKEVDFFSIGTNDLIQYTLAVERGNNKVAALYSPFHPAVLELIKRSIDAAHKARIPIGVCGEFAADFEGAKILYNFGIDELSVSPTIVPQLKEYIRTL